MYEQMALSDTESFLSNVSSVAPGPMAVIELEMWVFTWELYCPFTMLLF